MFLPYEFNKGTDQPAHPRSLISAFVARCLDSIISLVSISEISSLQLDSVAAQAGLCLTWLQTPKTGFLVTRLICQEMVVWTEEVERGWGWQGRQGQTTMCFINQNRAFVVSFLSHNALQHYCLLYFIILQSCSGHMTIVFISKVAHHIVRFIYRKDPKFSDRQV